jgi:hypothetical protein
VQINVEFDFIAIPSINKTLMLRFARCASKRISMARTASNAPQNGESE